MSDVPYEKLSIGGKRVSPSSGQYFDDINPATGEVVARIAAASVADVSHAVSEAKSAQKIWINMNPDEREATINRWADLVISNSKSLALYDTQDAGKPIRFTTKFDVPASSDRFRFAAELTRSIGNPQECSDRDYYMKEPRGVVGVITPANYPLLLLSNYAAPAIAAGNAVVAKPSPDASRSALLLVDLANEAGIPSGLFNVVTGDKLPAEVLTSHPDVKLIAYTGGTDGGRHIMETASRQNKKVILELGGKSAMIVCNDVDIESTIPIVYHAMFLNSGQLCTAASRLLIHREIYVPFIRSLVSYAAQKAGVGDPTDPKTKMGPLISERYLQKVLDYVSTGKNQANLIIGGERLTGNGFEKGYYMPPTIFDDVEDQSRLAQEEIFGPVLSILHPFYNLEEAVDRANRGRFGLAAGIQTKDPEKAAYAIRNLDVGTVWVNGSYNNFNAGVPFEGRRESGYGKGLGIYGFDEFTQLKTFNNSDLDRLSVSKFLRSSE